MAGRIRTIKPEFFLSSDLFDLEQRAALPIRVAFAGLFGQSDREGLFVWRPRQLKATILPFDDVDFEDVLRFLCVGGFVGCYESKSTRFGNVLTFARHQVVNNRERASEIPDPWRTRGKAAIVFARVADGWKEKKARVADAWGTRAPRVRVGTEGNGTEGNGTEGKGRERKGKEGKGSTGRSERRTIETDETDGPLSAKAKSRAFAVAEAIRKRVKPTKKQDDDLVVKVSILVAAGLMSEDDAVDAAEGAAIVEGVRNRSAYFLKCLYEKIGKSKMQRILARVDVAAAIGKGPP